MIFQIDQTFYDRFSPEYRAQLYSDIILHGHYVDCNYGLRVKFYDDINRHGSTLQKNMKEKDPSLNISTTLKNYLTTLNVNNLDIHQLETLINKPALLLLENEVNEKPVYIDIIQKYAKKDPYFKSLFLKLEDSLNNEDFCFVQAGGCSQIVPLFQSFDRGNYHGTAKFKISFLVDRDTDSDHFFDKDKNPIFLFTCAKDSNSIVDSDIYVLNQINYIWHMWYFREIENYFPPRQYENNNLDPSDVIALPPKDWHYKDSCHII